MRGESGQEQLIERIATGDRAAFEALVGLWRDPLWRFLRAHTPRPSVAEEALQETFLAVWRGAASVRDAASFRSWIYALARRQAARASRRRVGEPSDTSSLDALGADAGWGSYERGAAVVRHLEDREAVGRALAALSDDDREVLWLVDIEDLTLAEAADALGVTIVAAKSRLHRARLRFMAALDDGGTNAH